MQYLCGAAYNMLPWWVVDKILDSFLLTFACVTFALLLLVWGSYAVGTHSFRDAHVAPVLVFAFQTLPFSLLGIGIMRLMMFGTVSLCVLAGLLASPDFWQVVVDRASHCMRGGKAVKQTATASAAPVSAGSAKPTPGKGKAAPAATADTTTKQAVAASDAKRGFGGWTYGTMATGFTVAALLLSGGWAGLEAEVQKALTGACKPTHWHRGYATDVAALC